MEIKFNHGALVEAACDTVAQISGAVDVYTLPDGEVMPSGDLAYCATAGIAAAQVLCHSMAVAGGWWNDPQTNEPLYRNKGEMLCLIHSEISEAMEGERKGLMDDKLPHRPMAEVELADAIIRILDYAGGHGYDVAGAMAEKLAYNLSREDHKPENRVKSGGKQF